MASIDLNCDMGEGFGVYGFGVDDNLLDCVTSANIACGFHAGDPQTMQHTVHAALQRGVAIGAHPGLPDLVGFGRRNMAVTAGEVYAMVVYQVGALAAFVRAAGGVMHHVKPHGALYNMAARDDALADAIASAVHDVSPGLVLFGLAGGALIRAGQRRGLRTASEVFADRTYQEDGTLTPRTLPGAYITDVDEAVSRVLEMTTQGRVQSVQGKWIPLKAETVCIHGDGPQAVQFVQALRKALEERGVCCRPVSSADE